MPAIWACRLTVRQQSMKLKILPFTRVAQFFLGASALRPGDERSLHFASRNRSGVTSNSSMVEHLAITRRYRFKSGVGPDGPHKNTSFHSRDANLFLPDAVHGLYAVPAK